MVYRTYCSMGSIHCSDTMKIVEYIVDSLFPPRESEVFVRNLSTETSTRLYQKQIIDGCVYLSNYSDSVVSALITENKFYSNDRATQFLAKLLDTWLEETSSTYTLIPIPLSSKRERERGYNQVHRVLQQIYSKEHIIRTDLIRRTRDTKPQVFLQKTERLLNMTSAFTTNNAAIASLRDTTVVLIDDVYTTGATMRAASNVLRENLHPSCKIICLTLAH